MFHILLKHFSHILQIWHKWSLFSTLRQPTLNKKDLRALTLVGP